MIDITGVDLVRFIQEVYALSKPQGLGFLHYKEGDLPEAEARELIKGEGEPIPVCLDYVHGRACKITVARNRMTGALTIGDRWFDHSPADMDELLKRVGMARAA